jgi:hypothetical protein
MSTRLLSASVIIAVFALPFISASYAWAPAAEATLDWYAVAGGGGQTTGAEGYALAATVGQSVIGWMEGQHTLGTGFWYGALEQRYVVLLPLTMRDGS